MVKPQVGEVWADRRGREYGPLIENPGNEYDKEIYPLVWDSLAWSSTGEYLVACRHPMDLVELVRVTEAEVRAEEPVSPYAQLRRVLDAAFDQSATGKGADRHANHNAEPFEEQDIVAIPSRYGATLAGPGFQIEKKMREANRMLSRGEHDAAKREVLGAIVYAAAAYLLIEGFEKC